MALSHEVVPSGLAVALVTRRRAGFVGAARRRPVQEAAPTGGRLLRSGRLNWPERREFMLPAGRDQMRKRRDRARLLAVNAEP